LLAAALIGGLVLYYQSREISRMFSSVRLGAAALSVTVRARSLLGQYVLFGLALAGSYVALAIGGVIVLGMVASGAFAGGEFDLQIFMQHLQGSFTVLVAIIFGYL